MKQFFYNRTDDKRFISHIIISYLGENITKNYIFFHFFLFEFLMLKISNVTVNGVKIPIKARSIKLENKMKSRFIHSFQYLSFSVTFGATCV